MGFAGIYPCILCIHLLLPWTSDEVAVAPAAISWAWVIKNTPYKGNWPSRKECSLWLHISTLLLHKWKEMWFLPDPMSNISEGNYPGNEGWKGEKDVEVRSHLCRTFDGAALCGKHISSGELRKCHYYCKTNTENYYWLGNPSETLMAEWP